jgi:rhamnosyltransferase
VNAGRTPLVSVVIPTLNAGESFGRLLETIHDQRVEGGLELVIVDSGSSDGTVDLARRAGAKVISIARRAFSHGGTRNRAIAACSGRFIGLTVQDALPTDPFWLARLLEPLLADENAAGSFGLQVAQDRASLLARTKSSLWCEANRCPVTRRVEGEKEFWTKEPEERLDLVRFDNVTSCVRRETWAEVPFPEYSYGEDMAWAREVLLAGHSTAYVPTAQVWHSHERDHL